MRRAWYFIAALISASAYAQTPQQTADGLEVGVRYWLSSGETSRSIDASFLDPTAIHPSATGTLNPSATTTYEKLDANIIELFARKRVTGHGFVKGTVGLGKINSGTLTDETFFLIGSQPFQTKGVSGADGKLGYATLDVGRELTQGRETAFSVFVGYQYWKEEVDANGFTDAFGGPLSLPPGTLYITNQIEWHALRLGGELRVTRGRTKLIVEGTWIPYAGYRNEATHHLDPASSPVATGNGRGGTFDAEIRRSFPQLGGFDVGVGVRYWKLYSYKGTETAPGFSFPIVNLESLREGFTFTVAKSW
jgi:hypothetical protein